MPKLLVIADDLSGATDVGVQFTKQGVPAFVIIRSEKRNSLPDLFRRFEVVVVNAESRHVASDEARLAIRKLTEEARQAGVELFYKKTDSTLRGNVGAELDALLKTSGFRTLCFVPAHPALGRTTRDGVQFVHGVLLNESNYARDLRNPVRESCVAALLGADTDAPITLIHRNRLSEFSKNRPEGIVVFDAEAEMDVVAAAGAIGDAGRLNVLAGPAALASCLPDLIPFTRESADWLPLPQKFLVVNGSLNEASLRQCAEAEKAGFRFVRMPTAALLSDGVSGEEARDAVAQEIRSLLRAHCDVVLGSVRELFELNDFKRAGKPLLETETDWPDRIALNTGRILARIHSTPPYNTGNASPLTLVVIGGDTLAGVARANGWRALLPRSELLRGLAVCEVADQPDLVLISKPGGFGDDRVLARMRESASA
jgi:uncharacterized protein YgbK (DUF1537 family)